MKKTYALLIIPLVLLVASCCNNRANSETEKNKETALRYHKLDPSDIDNILADNFIGHQNNLFTWEKENHRTYLSNNEFKQDSVIQQVAEGNWVSTRFLRKLLIDGDTIRVPAMHFKRFENGKIAEIWEYFDSRQVETE